MHRYTGSFRKMLQIVPGSVQHLPNWDTGQARDDTKRQSKQNWIAVASLLCTYAIRWF